MLTIGAPVARLALCFKDPLSCLSSLGNVPVRLAANSHTVPPAQSFVKLIGGEFWHLPNVRSASIFSIM
jgi:hypothetical protein